MFVVSRVIPGLVTTNKVTEMDNSLVQGTFQEQELQKLQVPDDALYPIEAIMKRSGNKLLVKWVGRSDKFSSWALKKNVENVKRPEN